MEIDFFEEEGLRKGLTGANGFVQIASKIHFENLQRGYCV